MPTEFEENKEGGALATNEQPRNQDKNIIKVETHDINKIICLGDSMRYMKFAIGPMDWTIHEFSAA